MSSKQVGTAVLNFGTKDETWGLVDSLTVKYQAEKEEHKDGDGNIVSVVYHGAKLAISGSFTKLAAVGAGASTLKSGDTLTFKLDGTNTIVAIVDSWSDEYKRATASVRSFEATFYPDLTASSTTSSSSTGA